MKYSVRFWAAMHGDAIPLIYVAEAMARHTASGYGSLPVHGQTLVEVRPSRQAQLLGASNTGQLKVCDSQGRVAPASEIISAAQIPANSQVDIVLSPLYAKTKHLLEWGVTNGDDFEFVDTPGKMFQYDLKNESGEVLEADYYRGSVGGGESEPVAATVDVSGLDHQQTEMTQPQGVAVPAKPLQRTAAQDSAVLTEIKKQGYDPLALPKNPDGKPGVKAAIRRALKTNKLFTGSTVFDKAWARLTTHADIVIKG